MGRSLGYKSQEDMQIDLDKAISRFKEPVDTKVDPRLLQFLFKLKVPKDTPHIPYSESASIFNNRDSGGQKQIFQDFYEVLKYIGVYENDHIICKSNNKYQALLNFCAILDSPFLHHTVNCRDPLNCSNPRMHFPFRLSALPETGFRTRCASIPPETVCFATDRGRNKLLKTLRENPICGPAFRGNYNLDYKSDIVDSVDFSSATDRFSLRLQSVFYQGLFPFFSEIERIYLIVSLSSTRIIKKQDVVYPGLDYFLRRYPCPDGIPTEETVEDHINSKGYSESFKSYMTRLFYGDLKHPSNARRLHLESPLGVAYRKYYRMKHFGKQILDDMVSYYRFMFSSEDGFLSLSGQHMSLPISFITLTLVNVFSATMCGAYCRSMGDDMVISGTMSQIMLYREMVQNFGLVINKDKDVISQCGRAVFCEFLYDRSKKLELVRAKTILQPGTRNRVLHITDETGLTDKLLIDYVISRRIMNNLEEYCDLLLYFPVDLPKSVGGLGLDSDIPFKLSFEDPYDLYHWVWRYMSIVSDTNKVTRFQPLAFICTGMICGTTGYHLKEVIKRVIALQIQHTTYELRVEPPQNQNPLPTLKVEMDKLIASIVPGPYEEVLVYSERIKTLMEETKIETLDLSFWIKD
jgi:hypothetical protein